MLSATKITAGVMYDCAHLIYDETQIITAAHEVSKSNVCVKGMQDLHNNNLHGAGHRPMAICLIHDTKITA